MATATEQLADVVVAAVRAVNAPLVAEVAALKATVAELESRPTLKYVGIWDGATQFNPGNITTFDGSAWHCNCATRAKPGTSNDWTLVVKRGKDGRDAR